MEQIADEMDATLFRAAFNPIIAEAHDASHGLYHAVTGDTLVQGKSGLPIFVGVMSFAVKAVIDKAAENGDLEDGDIYIFNDAHLGGTHLSDMRLVGPISTTESCSAILPRSGIGTMWAVLCPATTTRPRRMRFRRRSCCRPCVWRKAGEVQTDIIDILMRNTRLPQSAQGDLNGQLGRAGSGREAAGRTAGGIWRQTRCAPHLMRCGDRAEVLMRAELTDLPDGRWEAEDFLDNDGITDTPLKIRVALEIRGEPMTLDFAGTADRCAGPVNIALPTAVATAYVAIKHIFPALPANAGVMRPINVVIPDGSLLSAPFPAPVGGYTETILRMIDVIFAAASQAAPDRVVANAYGTINALSIAGQAGERPALGDVQLLRRRPWRIARKRRAEPRQRADLDGHDPADGDTRGRLSGHVPAMGAAPGQRGCGSASWRDGGGLRDRSAGGRRPPHSCSANAAALPRRVLRAAVRPR